MHPDCSIGRLRVWASTDKEAKRKLSYVMGELYDYVVWGMTDGAEYLRWQWGSKEAWCNAVEGYKRAKKMAWVSRMASMESNKLGRLVDTNKRGGFGFATSQSYPDSRAWVQECVSFLTEGWGGAMAAHILGVIELSDLAALCYRGDALEAKHAVSDALLALREWFNVGTEAA